MRKTEGAAMQHTSTSERPADRENQRSRNDDRAEPLSHCWSRDEDGNLYRLLTPSEQDQLRAGDHRTAYR